MSKSTIDTLSVFKSAASAIYSGIAALAIIGQQVASLRESGIKFGKSKKTCQYRVQFSDAMKAVFQGKAEKTYANYVTSFVSAVNDGTEFSYSHSKGKSKGKKKSDADKTIFPVLAKLFSHEGFAALASELSASYDNDEGSLADLIRATLESEGFVITE